MVFLANNWLLFLILAFVFAFITIVLQLRNMRRLMSGEFEPRQFVPVGATVLTTVLCVVLFLIGVIKS